MLIAEMLFILIFWILVYAFEAKHDTNYKTIDGSEKLWDAAMFAVLHISFGLLIWYYDEFWKAFYLTCVSLSVRLFFHDGFINYFRGKRWCAPFTVDNDKDYWDMFMVWLYNKKIKPCFLTGGLLVVLIIFYFIIFN